MQIRRFHAFRDARREDTIATELNPVRPDRDVDALDGRLIHALQENGRASILDLARLLGVPRDYVSLRLRALTERGGLRIVAALDPGFAGHHVLTHATVRLNDAARPVAERIAGLSDAVFVSLVSGSRPLIFESRHGDVRQLHELLAQVRAIPAVEQVRVTTYAEVLKGFFVAESRSDIILDEIDEQLIAQLQRDGRASYRELGDAVHLSPSSARSRVRRLIDAGVIRIAAIPSGGLSRNRLAVGVGVTLRDDAEPVRRYIIDQPAIEFAARTHGVHDFIATIAGSTSAGVLAVLEDLRALSQVAALESWAHLDIVKEDYTRALGRVVPT